MKPKRFLFNHEQFQFLRSHLQDREIYYIAGNSSLFIPSRNEKYILAWRKDGSKTTKKWEDENGEVMEMTAGEAARAELRKCFPGLKRVGWTASNVTLFQWRWPMLYTGPMKGDLSYIDLKGAYWQLYSRLWLDTAFPNGYGTLSLLNVADALRDWKPARNSVIGICAARETLGVKGYKSIHLKTQNPYLSPGLWATIQAILNELAFFAEKFGAKYIATDGYIFDKRSSADRMEELLLDNGLSYRRSNGQGEVKGWATYKVDGKETQTYRADFPGRSKPFRAIRIFDNQFPNRIIRWWSKSVPRYSKANWQMEVVEK